MMPSLYSNAKNTPLTTWFTYFDFPNTRLFALLARSSFRSLACIQTPTSSVFLFNFYIGLRISNPLHQFLIHFLFKTYPTIEIFVCSSNKHSFVLTPLLISIENQPTIQISAKNFTLKQLKFFLSLIHPVRISELNNSELYYVVRIFFLSFSMFIQLDNTVAILFRKLSVRF